MQIQRIIEFYENYFMDFYLSQDSKVQEKIDYVLDMVKNLPIIPAKFFKCIDNNNGIYEVRIKSGSSIYRIFCFFTEDKQIALINCFQKKTQKTPVNAVALACRLKEKYFEEKREKLK